MLVCVLLSICSCSPPVFHSCVTRNCFSSDLMIQNEGDQIGCPDSDFRFNGVPFWDLMFRSH